MLARSKEIHGAATDAQWVSRREDLSRIDSEGRVETAAEKGETPGAATRAQGAAAGARGGQLAAAAMAGVRGCGGLGRELAAAAAERRPGWNRSREKMRERWGRGAVLTRL
jgi:hypothetical protein